MTSYYYKARSKSGVLKEETIESDSLETARKKLTQNGMRVIYLEEAQGKKIYIGGPPKVKGKDLMMMTRQLSTLIKAGVPILTAIKGLIKQTENETLKDALKKIDRLITGGKKLSQSLAEFPKIFNEVYVNVVIAGEVGGVLPEVLDRLSVLIQKDEHIQSEVKGALRYPTYVAYALIGAFLFLVNFIVPKFSKMFKKFELDLPLPTKILIFLSDTLKSHWYVYIIVVVALIYGFKSYMKTKNGQITKDKIQLKLPVIGELVIKFTMARSSNLMSTLIKSGVPALNCIEIVRKTIENSIIKDEFVKIKRRVESGAPIHEYMEESMMFPPLMVNMVKVGEESGALDQTLETIAEHYEMETEMSVKKLTELIEPVVTVITGVMVLGLALSIFLPMWDLTKMTKG